MSKTEKPDHPKLAAFIAEQAKKGVIVNITKTNTILPMSAAREWAKYLKGGK